LEEVIFPSLFQLGRSYFSNSSSTWKKLFFQVFFNFEEVIFGSLFWKNFTIN
jgi:hypothetical protein